MNDDLISEDAVLGDNSRLEKISINELSSGERFIFFGLLWKFISQHNIKLLESEKIIYLLEESDSHLEQSAIEQYMKIIQNDLSKKFGIKVILSTHNVMTVNFFKDENVFSCLENKEDEFEINSLDYSKANLMLTNNLYLSFRKGRLKNVKIFDDLWQEFYSETELGAGNSIEYLIYLYFKFEKEKTLNFFKEEYPNQYLNTTDQIEFIETEKFLKDIDLDKDFQFDWNNKMLYILWPPEFNVCFDFMTIYCNKQVNKTRISFYQIGISTNIKKKLKEETFIGKENKFEKSYKNMIEKKINQDMYEVKYYLIHGREDVPYMKSEYEFQYDVPGSIIRNDEKKPKKIQLYSMIYFGTKFDSMFLQSFSQLEIKFKKFLKKRDKLNEFIKENLIF